MSGVVCKVLHGATYGNDPVVCKGTAAGSFGNDTVVNKSVPCETNGNYGSMFIRVRRRKLKGGHPEWRAYRERSGDLVTESASYDVVRAVRVDGKPRQKFLCGLGSVKQGRDSDHHAARACVSAIYRMERAGFDAIQRRKLLLLAHSKGFPFPTHDSCVRMAARYEKHPQHAAHIMAVAEIVGDMGNGS